ncbi:MAG: hypothetical protein ACYSSI_10355 [Planctomycetota bacterium]|jgi:hypothetical protein
MIKKKVITFKDIEKTVNAIVNDIKMAKAFYYILFEIRAPLFRIKAFRNKCPILFKYSGWALDISYIVTLYKLFEKGNSLNLRILINQICNLSKSEQNPIDKMKYNIFVKKSKRYLNEIDLIEEKLNPLRNMFRTHNFPDRKVIKKSYWNQTKKWLEWASNIFNEALISVDFPSWHFFQYAIEDEKKYLFGEIKKKNLLPK